LSTAGLPGFPQAARGAARFESAANPLLRAALSGLPVAQRSAPVGTGGLCQGPALDRRSRPVRYRPSRHLPEMLLPASPFAGGAQDRAAGNPPAVAERPIPAVQL